MSNRFYKYLKTMQNYRGQIIHDSILLERFIDYYLATYFCDNLNKANDLLELIISTNRIIFENKVQIFKVLLERHEPDFLKSNKGIINEILSIIQHRNVFAHYTPYAGDDAIQKYEKSGIITLIKYKNSTEFIEYTPAECEKIITNISKYTTAIRLMDKLQVWLAH